MAAVRDRVTEDALSLPADARLRLVETLLTSLNLPIQEDIDRAWAEEAERRVSQIESGEAKLLPGEEVLQAATEVWAMRFSYQVKSDNIRILAVADLRRRPGYWRGRK